MKNFINKFVNNKLLLILTIVLQVFILVLIFNPLSLISQNEINNIINRAVELGNDPDFAQSRIAKVSDASEFKKEYMLDDKYADLQNNDYILLTATKILIYRKNEDKIILQGKAPSSMLNNVNLASSIEQSAINQKIIKEQELPALYFPDSEKLEDFKDYFKDINENEILVFFPKNKIIILYNIQTDKIVGTKQLTLSM